MCAGNGAVDLADQLHVVEEGVEGVEVGEAHHVGDAASCSLQDHPKMLSGQPCHNVLITCLFSFKLMPPTGTIFSGL